MNKWRCERCGGLMLLIWLYSWLLILAKPQWYFPSCAFHAARYPDVSLLIFHTPGQLFEFGLSILGSQPKALSSQEETNTKTSPLLCCIKKLARLWAEAHVASRCVVSMAVPDTAGAQAPTVGDKDSWDWDATSPCPSLPGGREVLLRTWRSHPLTHTKIPPPHTYSKPVKEGGPRRNWDAPRSQPTYLLFQSPALNLVYKVNGVSCRQWHPCRGLGLSHFRHV